MICTWMFAKCVEKAARVDLSLSFNDRIHAKCNTLWTLLNARHQSRWTNNSGDRMVVIQRCEERFKSATNVEECHRDSPRNFFFNKNEVIFEITRDCFDDLNKKTNFVQRLLRCSVHWGRLRSTTLCEAELWQKYWKCKNISTDRWRQRRKDKARKQVGTKI